jgi:ribosomal protein L7/L12
MVLVWIIGGAIVVYLLLVVLSVMGITGRRWGDHPKPGEATMADVTRLARNGEKIAAIRCYREIHNVGLAEAKEAVEQLADPS